MSELLLAKSGVSDKPPKTLVDHTREVIATVGFLYGTTESPTRLAREWIRFFRLESEEYSRFLANTIAAAAFHDIGKANDGFQKVVTHKGDQSIRHEHLSGLLLSLLILTHGYGTILSSIVTSCWPVWFPTILRLIQLSGGSHSVLPLCFGCLLTSPILPGCLISSVCA